MPVNETVKETPKKSGPLQILLNVLGVLLCVIFIPIIILNVVMIVKSYSSPDEIPSVFGYSPVIVLSGSMSPTFEAGDMILLQKTDPYTLKVNDVICYMEEESAVTHRIIEVQQQDGMPMYITQGDANNTEDSTPVTPDQVQGKYTGIYITGLGDFAIFLQSTPGMLIFVGGPIVLILLWDVLRRMVSSRKERSAAEADAAAADAKQQELEQELARLRAQVGAGQQPSAPPQQAPVQPIVAPVRPVQKAPDQPPPQESPWQE